MKRLAISLALMCVFSVSAMAVDMPTCGITSQEPPPETSGYIPTSDSEAPESALTTFLLSLLSSLV